jgi:cytochrome c-type biogenesis protein
VTDPGLVGFAFSLGVATFFAPCAFPLLPGYVAFFVGRESDDAGTPWPRQLRQAVTVALVTSLGFLAVFGTLAAVVFALGSQVLGGIAVLELVAGAVLIALGAAMVAGRSPLGHLQVALPERRRGPVGYFAFGVVYAVAAAGCTGSLFVGVASLALAGPADAVSLFGAYAGGMVLLMVGVTVLSALGRDALVRTAAANTGRITRVAGAVLVVAGVVQLYYFLVVFDGLAYL